MKKAPTKPEDILTLARCAALDLPAAYHQELVSAYGHVEDMLSRLHRGRPMLDEPAHVFQPAKLASEDSDP
jgi:hypothetical protein